MAARAAGRRADGRDVRDAAAVAVRAVPFDGVVVAILGLRLLGDEADQPEILAAIGLDRGDEADTLDRLLIDLVRGVEAALEGRVLAEHRAGAAKVVLGDRQVARGQLALVAVLGGDAGADAQLAAGDRRIALALGVPADRDVVTPLTGARLALGPGIGGRRRHRHGEDREDGEVAGHLDSRKYNAGSMRRI